MNELSPSICKALFEALNVRFNLTLLPVGKGYFNFFVEYEKNKQMRYIMFKLRNPLMRKHSLMVTIRRIERVFAY